MYLYKENDSIKMFIVIERSSHCYDALGCVVTNSSWYSWLNRPFNLQPWSREQINTNFTVFTRLNPTTVKIKQFYFKISILISSILHRV